jgi:hypothetical protein
MLLAMTAMCIDYDPRDCGPKDDDLGPPRADPEELAQIKLCSSHEVCYWDGRSGRAGGWRLRALPPDGPGPRVWNAKDQV